MMKLYGCSWKRVQIRTKWTLEVVLPSTSLMMPMWMDPMPTSWDSFAELSESTRLAFENCPACLVLGLDLQICLEFLNLQATSQDVCCVMKMSLNHPEPPGNSLAT